MVTYTVLGATGSTGSELVKLLLPSPTTYLNLYARSSTRLHALHPTLSHPDHQSHISIFTGALDDIGLISRALNGADTAFVVLAQNTNDPACRIARDAAGSVIEALHLLRKEAVGSGAGEGWVCPTVVYLSSTTLSPVLASAAPGWITWVAKQAFWYIYADLRAAFEMFDSPENKFIPFIQACPGGLVKASSKGARLSLEPGGPPSISYADLALGMVDIAMGKERWVGEQVGVFGMEEPDVSGVELLGWLAPGLLCSWLPPVWRAGKWLGWW